jgi:hypothetical protein
VISEVVTFIPGTREHCTYPTTTNNSDSFWGVRYSSTNSQPWPSTGFMSDQLRAPATLTPRKDLSTPWTAGWVGQTASLEALENIIIIPASTGITTLVFQSRAY